CPGAANTTSDGACSSSSSVVWSGSGNGRAAAGGASGGFFDEGAWPCSAGGIFVNRDHSANVALLSKKCNVDTSAGFFSLARMTSDLAWESIACHSCTAVFQACSL